MLGYDPTGERGINRYMPDKIVVLEPVESKVDAPTAAIEQDLVEQPAAVAAPEVAQVAQAAQAYQGAATEEW